MSAETGSVQLNENHQRHIRSTFQYIDKLLSEAEHAMIDAGSPSPFQEYSDDTTPVQRKVTHDYIVHIRDAMRRVIEELNITPAEPRCGAIWAASISLMFSNISLADLTPEKMRGYGQLSDESLRIVDEIRAELGGLLEKLRAYLGQAASGDLQARLERLEKTGNEVELLRELERIVTAHALVQFRSALTTLVDRLETVAFEVGVFGRVSSGKSSLLNYILQTNILPVGVTPITAIPTRISYGPVAEAGIEFAEAQPKIIQLSDLAEYATEQRNPSNVKHVTRIVVKLPSPRLNEGVTFVDTPGVGSLAIAGAEETVAYLPRCDLGIVLVDASSGLTQDDLMVLQALYQAGSTASLLISKADLHDPADRERIVEYVKKHLRKQLKIEPPVHAVSIMGDDAALCDEWFNHELQPMLQRHRELTAISHKRKIGALGEAVMGALQRRLEAAAEMDDSSLGQKGEGESEALQTLRSGERSLERGQATAFQLTRKISQMQLVLLQKAAEEIATIWSGSDSANVQEIFSKALNQMVGGAVSACLEAIEATREELMRGLQAAAQTSGQPITEELPKATGLPVFDAMEITGKIGIQRPAMLSFLGTTALVPYVRRQLEKQLDRTLSEFLSLYANRLRKWMEQMLFAMRDAFAVAADAYRAQLGPADANAIDASAMESDLRILQDWNRS